MIKIIFPLSFFAIQLGFTKLSGDGLLTKNDEVIVDSDYTFEEAIGGLNFPDEVKENLVLIPVEYFSMDKKLHRGQVVIHKDLEKDIIKIFNLIKEKKFPVEKAIPIVKYNWDDETSMQDNNTSAFNYRFVKETKRLSNHSYGRAIDINPLLNPYVKRNSVEPEGAVYIPEKEGTITENSFLVKEFLTLGWEWGGFWKDGQDYQHFQKVK